jgi:NAD-dependent SIR2 family protein deacetylase
VTQNIDNFHTEIKNQRISKNKNIKDYPIYEIHGNILKVRCNHCSIEDKTLYEEPFESYLDILEMKCKLYCPRCEGPLRPQIMFFD